jgi:serine/threonine protein kinase
VGTDSSLLSNGVKERATSPIKVVNESGEHILRHAHRFHGDEDAQLKQFGRHGDINPSNILWYDDGDDDRTGLQGTLKITDFGQAEINSMLSKTRHRSVANTLTYRPPECDVQSSMIRQSYDIWCLGCVYLEFVTWLLGGNHLVKKFVRMRSSPDAFHHGELSDTFFQVTNDTESCQSEFMIKPAVTQV